MHEPVANIQLQTKKIDEFFFAKNCFVLTRNVKKQAPLIIVVTMAIVRLGNQNMSSSIVAMHNTAPLHMVHYKFILQIYTFQSRL